MVSTSSRCGGKRAASALARGIVLIVAALIAMPQGYAREVRDSLLAPPDTSSPRETLESFLENMDRAFRAYYEGQDDVPPAAGTAEMRALACLDTSQLPPVRADRAAIEAALLLHDVLDRVRLPPFDEIPDEGQMATLPPDVPRAWRVPGTEIEIARVTQGRRAGEYLFSSQTVARAGEFYELARDMPYKAGAMDGLYERVAAAPGSWFPSRWFRAFPDWARQDIGGQPVWKWIAMVLTACLWLLLVYLAHRVTRQRDGEPRYWWRFALALALLPVTRWFRDFYESQLIVVGPAYVAMDDLIVILYHIIAAVAVINLGAAIAVTTTAKSRFEERILDANLITFGCHSVAWLIAIFIVAKGVSDLGVPLAAVIASLGVGGIAFALAARPTLENLIAGMTLYLDKPVKIGQFCQFEDVLGTVERIGLRSTRIRRWGGNLLSVPNSQFVEHQLDNYNDARNIWIRQKMRLRYDTSLEQLAYVLAKIREMLFAHPKVLLPRVRLIGFGDDALTVEVICYTDTGVWAEWHAIREDVLLRVMEIFEAAGTRLALPSKTNYFTRDQGLDENRRRAAEQQVRDWIEAGELPFPDMTEEQRKALEGTLQFPPEGSVQLKTEFGKDQSG